MRKTVTSILMGTLTLSAIAQETSDFLNPDDFQLPLLPELPDNVRISSKNPEFNFKTGRVSYTDGFSLTSDTGMQLQAHSAVYNTKSQEMDLTGRVRMTLPDGTTLKANKANYSTKDQFAKLRGTVSLIQPSTDEGYGAQLFADKVDLDTKAQTAQLNGNVSIYTGPALHKGESAFYDYGKRRIKTENLRSGLDPLLLEAGAFRSKIIDGKQVYVGENAGITTHDVKDPNYWIRAKKTSIYPDEKVVFQDLKFYVKDRPVFWLPYLSQPFNKDLGYTFIPGAKTNWGPYLLNRYGIMLGGKRDPATGENEDAWLLSRWSFDILSRRGIGLGLDLQDIRRSDNKNLTGFSSYYLNDADATLRRAGTPRRSVNEDRFKYQYRDKFEVGNLLGNPIDFASNLTFLSDRFFLEDFEPRTFRLDPEPDNIVAFSSSNDSSLLTLLARIRLNDFYTTSTRLPELAFDQVRRPIWNTGVLHEGQSSIGLYKEDIADFLQGPLQQELDSLLISNPTSSRIGEIRNLLAERGFTRFHTYQEFSLPLKIGGTLNVIPRAGIGYTSYSSIEGPEANTDRTHLFAGVDTSLKFTKYYENLINKDLGIDGLLHIIQPYANASWLRSDALNPTVGRIDTLTPTTRPRLRTPGRFTAIDDLADWGVLRLGIRNKLLTNRNSGTHPWLSVDTYIDAFSEDPEFDRNFSNLYNDLQWRPLPWIRLNLETQFPLFRDENSFSEVSASTTFMPNASTEISVGNRFLRDHPILQDSNLLDFRIFHRFNEMWGLNFQQRWELEDGTLEVQRYNIQRDFQSWIISAGLLFRDNRTVDEYGFLLNFTLKEFPDINLPLSIDSE